VILSSTVGAAEELADPDVAVEAARQALRSGWDFPWYDNSTDSLQRISVEPPAQPARWSLDWDLSNVLAILGWLAIAVLLAVLAYALIAGYLSRETLGSLSLDDSRVETTATTIDRVAALPVALRDPTADFLQLARQHYEAGNLSEAIIYLFSYQLLELDRNHLVQLAKGKTNRQYLRELKRSQPATSGLDEILQKTILLFEQAFFGARRPDTAAFAVCWQALPDFESQLTSGGRS
jgi:hypothetical protein